MIQRGQRPGGATVQRPSESHNGAAPNGTDSQPPAPDSWARQLNLLQAAVIPTLLITILVVVGFAVLYWSETTYFVATDNATIAGEPVVVSLPSAGQIRALYVDVGDLVQAHQLLGLVAFPMLNSQMQLRAPIEGMVVARHANVGEVSQSGGQSSGRPVFTLVDPAQLWIEARVEEWRAGRVRSGQRAEVWIDSVGGPFGGTVTAVAGGSNAWPSVQPPSAGPFIRQTQWVPVRIHLDPDGPPLFLGGSASVRIRVDG
jgi:multidrug resistance efflux pump